MIPVPTAGPRLARRLLLVLPLAALAWGLPARAASTVPYTAAAFDRAVADGGPVVLHVSAPWCPTCQAQKPIVAALLKEPRMQAVRLFVADFDSERALKEKLHVAQQSTFVVFRHGREVARSTAELDPKAIAAIFSKAL